MSLINSYLQNGYDREPHKAAAAEIDEARQQVQRGTEDLASVYGEEWWEDIEPSLLDMSSCLRCVLGQLEGEFSDGLAKLANELDDSEDNLVNYDGFDAGGVNFDALTVAWLEELTGETYDPQDYA
jgi:hypothetical protein